jgi:hypothetical protein
MPVWKTHLEKYDLLLKELDQNENGKLRFGKKLITATDIAKQDFCEKQIEMKYQYGEVETEAKTMGTLAHEKLTEDSEEVKKAQMWRKIYGKKSVAALEMFILAKYRDVIIAGKPDSVVFKSGMPLMIFEYKFSRNSTPYLSYHIQARTYGLILENLGFDTSQLHYAIVIADPKTKGSQELRNQVVIATAINGRKEAILPIKNATIHIHKFKASEVEKYITCAIEFWKEKRNATPTNNPNKCAKCEYQKQCQP